MGFVFTIEESLVPYQPQLAIPAFTRGKSQLDPIDIEKTQGIANVRVCVEKVIGLLLKAELYNSAKYSTCRLLYVLRQVCFKVSNVDRIIRECSGLTN